MSGRVRPVRSVRSGDNDVTRCMSGTFVDATDRPDTTPRLIPASFFRLSLSASVCVLIHRHPF